jgi:hypothetical protein
MFWSLLPLLVLFFQLVHIAAGGLQHRYEGRIAFLKWLLL